MILAIFASLLSLGMQSFPAGSVICLENEGGVAFGCSESICCESMIREGGLMHSAPAVPVSGVFSCKRCVDLVLPHDRFHQSQKWTVDAPARSAKRILVGMIIWPPLRMVSVVEDVRDDREPPYLIQIATTVIQC